MDDMRPAGKHTSKLLAMGVLAMTALYPVLGVAAPPTKDGTQSGTPSSKATATINTVSVCATSTSSGSSPFDCTSTSGQWVNVGPSTTIKTSNVADLFVGVSLVTGLFTSTQVVGHGDGSKSSATAMGGVTLRVVLDDGTNTTYPDNGNGVTFDQRIQTLSANLGNIFTDCFAQGGTTGTGCTLTPEQITLVLDTTSAHSYNYILLNVGSGVHTLQVQAQINSDATGLNGGVAVSEAMFGLGSVTVEAVRLVNSFSF